MLLQMSSASSRRKLFLLWIRFSMRWSVNDRSISRLSGARMPTEKVMHSSSRETPLIDHHHLKKACQSNNRETGSRASTQRTTRNSISKVTLAPRPVPFQQKRSYKGEGFSDESGEAVERQGAEKR